MTVPTQRAGPRWTPEEDATLRAVHPDYDQLVEDLPLRSRRAIEKRASRLQLDPPRRRWGAHEDAVLRRLYPDYTRLSQALPGRSRKALERRAENLGIVRSRHIWTAPREKLLGQLYARGVPLSDVLAVFPEMTARQVNKRVSRSRFRRPPPKMTPTGFPLVDQVRRRGSELGISMRKLSQKAGAKWYFVGPTSMNAKFVQRAVEALGGDFVITWDEG